VSGKEIGVISVISAIKITITPISPITPILMLIPSNYITRGIFRPSHSEQPQFTDVNEDCEEKRNAKITPSD
jgi:hypothetical protein